MAEKKLKLIDVFMDEQKIRFHYADNKDDSMVESFIDFEFRLADIVANNPSNLAKELHTNTLAQTKLAVLRHVEKIISEEYDRLDAYVNRRGAYEGVL